MAYEYDIFLSYPRQGSVGIWVHQHFLPLLQESLDGQLADSPKIFVDGAQPTGVTWPANIQKALLESRLLVAVWTPPYFRSDWCKAEWTSMLEREMVLEKQGLKPARGLVYPVVYSDGKHFDPRAKATQQRSLRDYTYPYPSFKDTVAYLAFHDAMKEVAFEIEEHLNAIPPWDPTWTVVLPPSVASKPLGLARL